MKKVEKVSITNRPIDHDRLSNDGYVAETNIDEDTYLIILCFLRCCCRLTVALAHSIVTQSKNRA